jgi:hypothetical protein
MLGEQYLGQLQTLSPAISGGTTLARNAKTAPRKGAALLPARCQQIAVIVVPDVAFSAEPCFWRETCTSDRPVGETQYEMGPATAK